MQDDVVMVLCNSNECRGNCDLSLLCDTKPTLGVGSWNPPGINPSFAFVALRDLPLLNMGQRICLRLYHW